MAPDLRNEAQTMIAQALGETEPTPIEQIGRVIDCLGTEKTIELVKEARAIQRAGGMATKDGSRKRSIGGVFFRIVHPLLTAQQRHVVWPERAERRKAMRQERATIQK